MLPARSVRSEAGAASVLAARASAPNQSFLIVFIVLVCLLALPMFLLVKAAARRAADGRIPARRPGQPGCDGDAKVS